MNIYVTTQAEWDRAESMMSRRLDYDPAFSGMDYTIGWADEFVGCHVTNVDEYAGAIFLSELFDNEELAAESITCDAGNEYIYGSEYED